MRYFSYNDYMDYKGNIDMNNYGRVEEEKAEYILEDGEINSQFEIIEILKTSAHKHGKCVIVVTHSKELAKKSDVILVLKNKKLTM